MIRTVTVTLAAGLLLVALLAVACSSDDNDSPGDTPATEASTDASAPTDAAEPTEADGALSEVTGTAIVTVDGDTSRMDVQDCLAPDDGGPIGITASSDAAELNMSGIGGLVTLDFKRGDDEWIAVGAELTIDGANITYDGPALKNGADPPDAQILVDVTC